MTENRRANVIWIMADQLRVQAIGFLGDPNVHTPNIDRLAIMGVTFDRAVAGRPICSPDRACVLSGRYSHQNGVLINNHRMDTSLPTIATAFNDEGYHTAWFGKWHVDAPQLDATAQSIKAGLEYVVPRERRGGFASWLGYENLMNPAESWISGHNEAGEEVAPYLMEKWDTDGLTDLMIDYLQRRGEERRNGEDKPFFAALSCFAPHDPYFAPEEWMAPYTPGKMKLRANVPDIPRIQQQAKIDTAGYCAMIANLDWNLGRICQQLSAQGLARDTHIIFFSDHGDMLGSHGFSRKSLPYEEALRVPFFIGGEVTRWCDWEGRGSGRCDAPLNHVDVAPTTLGLCGIAAPASMVGTDYSGYRITGRTKNDPDSAFIGLWKPMGWDGLDWPWRGLVTRDGWKYAEVEGQPLMMFNLNEDPYEMVNLIYDPTFAARRRQLQTRLKKWSAQTGDDFRYGQA